MAGTLTAGYRSEAADLDAEILTGFLHALRGGVDPARLCFAAWRASREPRLARQEYPLVDDFERAADIRPSTSTCSPRPGPARPPYRQFRRRVSSGVAAA
jgi:hypothetical protein